MQSTPPTPPNPFPPKQTEPLDLSMPKPTPSSSGVLRTAEGAQRKVIIIDSSSEADSPQGTDSEPEPETHLDSRVLIPAPSEGCENKAGKIEKAPPLKHKDKKKHKCTTCGKVFTRSFTLKQHQRVHTQAKPYLCSQCGQSFSHACNLKEHERNHTGEKPYSCSQCDQSFSRSSTLKKHQRVHTGERPYSCSQCDQSFSHLFNLKQHQLVHTGEKPYGCRICGKSFSQPGNLKRHQRTHSGKGTSSQ